MPILRRSVVQFCSAPLVRFHTALDTRAYSDKLNFKVKVLYFVKSGGLAFLEDTTKPFSGISWAFFPGIKLSSGMGTVIPLSQST